MPKQVECHKCGTQIHVSNNDVAERYYCYPCAMSKLGATP
jgi:formylmethanofuran dehydrogenase subunit E